MPTIATTQVFDFETQSGDPLNVNPSNVAGALITATLNYNQVNAISPQANLQAVRVQTLTDTTGRWQLNLIPNNNINPANTLWTISTPTQNYQISVPASGPVQSSSIKVASPVTFSPSSSTSGPLTVAGLLTAQAGETVTGGLSTDQMTVRGLTGAANSSRWVGSTVTVGPPATGTFSKGDVVIDQNGLVWICVVAGTPGTWTASGSGLLHAEVYQNAAQSIPTGATFTVVAYDTVEADGMGWYSTVNRNFTPTITGRFLVTAALTWAAANAAQGQLAVFVNGAIARNLTIPNASHITLSGAGVVRVTTANQPIDVRILQQSGAAINTNTGAINTWAQFTYLGPL